MGHEKLPTLRRQLRDRHPRKDRVVVEQHPQEDHLERLRHPRGGEHHEPVAEPAETFGLESGRVALGRMAAVYDPAGQPWSGVESGKARTTSSHLTQ